MCINMPVYGTLVGSKKACHTQLLGEVGDDALDRKIVQIQRARMEMKNVCQYQLERA